MTAKQRVITLKLLEKQKRHPVLAKKLGVRVEIKKNEK